MKVSDEDRRRMQRLARELELIETDDIPDEATMRVRIAAANEWRARHGIPALEEVDANPPELEFYRYARAIGLSRRRG
jgi:hypothetical protein